MAYDGTCDCWTDTDGYWRLGPHCTKVEMNEWSRAMNLARELSERIRHLKRQGQEDSGALNTALEEIRDARRTELELE